LDGAGIQIGSLVLWENYDDDVEQGHVGEVTSWKNDLRVYVDFPNGCWHFPLDELRLAPPEAMYKRKRDGGQGAQTWRPKQQGQFESYLHAINENVAPLGTLTADATHLAGTGSGWLWIGASDEPRCTLEHMAQEIFRFHTSGNDELPGGAEFKVEVRDGHPAEQKPPRGPESDFQFYKDEVQFEQDGSWLQPALCTVTFLSPCGAPTVVFDSRCCDTNRPRGPPRSYVSYPVPGKHISMLGELYHGAPDELSAERLLGIADVAPRVVLLVNIWPTHKPVHAARLGPESLAAMSQYKGCFALDGQNPYRTQQHPYWSGRRGGRGEQTQLPNHKDALMATLPTGIVKKALWWKDPSNGERCGAHGYGAHTFWIRTAAFRSGR